MSKIKNTAYLVAYYFMRPKRNALTQIQGWSKDPKNLMYDEKVAIVKKISKSDQSMAKIILDIGNKEVVRNGWKNDLTFDQLFAYFHEGYPNYTKPIMEAFDPQYLAQLGAPATAGESSVGTAISSTISSA